MTFYSTVPIELPAPRIVIDLTVERNVIDLTVERNVIDLTITTTPVAVPASQPASAQVPSSIYSHLPLTDESVDLAGYESAATFGSFAGYESDCTQFFMD